MTEIKKLASEAAKKKHNRTCEQCGDKFVTYRISGRFCKDLCRVRWHAQTRKTHLAQMEQELAALRKVLPQARQ